MHLERLTSVLEAIAIAGRPLAAGDLHEMTRLPLPTCYRLLQLLREQRLIEDPGANNRYVIGERLVRIAFLAKTDADVCAVTAPILKKATGQFGEAVFLSRFREKGVSIIHVETPPDPSVSYIHPGLGYRPMHACSCSKAIAAFADDTFRELILNGPMKAYTSQTYTSRTELEKDFAQIQKRGYAECVEEIETGVSSVAAPVNDDNIGAVFSVGAIGPIRRFTATHRRALGESLIEVAAEIGTCVNNSRFPNSNTNQP
ncbi:IclR family transcriptional regulator [Chromatiales bacterium (ex Bugula neritina AB1)]|nr:IclR family transcriptional regulator [Chromatiales bacterium (ex Bugula neritina AB1)]